MTPFPQAPVLFVFFFPFNGVNHGSCSAGSACFFCFRIGDRAIFVPERRNEIFFFTGDMVSAIGLALRTRRSPLRPGSVRTDRERMPSQHNGLPFATPLLSGPAALAPSV